MQRRIVRVMGPGAVVAALAIAAPGLAASSGAPHHNVRFTENGVGASISRTQVVYKVHTSVAGNGAAVVTATGATTDTAVVYFVGASSDVRDRFKLGAPNGQGVSTFTGGGHFVGGTGKFKHVRGSFTFSGTYDITAGILRYTESGTTSY